MVLRPSSQASHTAFSTPWLPQDASRGCRPSCLLGVPPDHSPAKMHLHLIPQVCALVKLHFKMAQNTLPFLD